MAGRAAVAVYCAFTSLLSPYLLLLPICTTCSPVEAGFTVAVVFFNLFLFACGCTRLLAAALLPMQEGVAWRPALQCCSHACYSPHVRCTSVTSPRLATAAFTLHPQTSLVV